MSKTSVRAETKAYSAAIGARITTLRKSLGYTQAELARALGVSQQAVFAYELGDRRVSVLVLAKVAKVFATSVEELMGLTQPPHARKGLIAQSDATRGAIAGIVQASATLRDQDYRHLGK